MSSDVRGINRLLRELWLVTNAGSPNRRTRAERVAVYAVAIGQQLGFDEEQLLKLRVAAEINGIPNADAELLKAAATDELSRSIVALSEGYDSRRYGYAGVPQQSDAECVKWLETDARAQYGADLAAALKRVQAVIQPIGT